MMSIFKNMRDGFKGGRRVESGKNPSRSQWDISGLKKAKNHEKPTQVEQRTLIIVDKNAIMFNHDDKMYLHESKLKKEVLADPTSVVHRGSSGGRAAD